MKHKVIWLNEHAIIVIFEDSRPINDSNRASCQNLIDSTSNIHADTSLMGGEWLQGMSAQGLAIRALCSIETCMLRKLKFAMFNSGNLVVLAVAGACLEGTGSAFLVVFEWFPEENSFTIHGPASPPSSGIPDFVGLSPIPNKLTIVAGYSRPSTQGSKLNLWTLHGSWITELLPFSDNQYAVSFNYAAAAFSPSGKNRPILEFLLSFRYTCSRLCPLSFVHCGHRKLSCHFEKW